MNGMHNMGSMTGFAPMRRETMEPLFHIVNFSKKRITTHQPIKAALKRLAWCAYSLPITQIKGSDEGKITMVDPRGIDSCW